MGLQSFGDALQFLLIFTVDPGPKHFPRRLAEKAPIAVGIVRVAQFDGLKGIEDFRGQQIPVLITDLARGAFQVEEDPAAPVESVGAL